MNIFVHSECPMQSAIKLPDRHITKMPLETCQMLSIVASEKWGHNYGKLPKKDGTFYQTEKGAFRNHPCTIWANESIHNARWLIEHGFYLCQEYTFRYGKTHACEAAILRADEIFPEGDYTQHTAFVRAMPEELKNNNQITTTDAYKIYLNTKPWAFDNYLRCPDRRPQWMKQNINHVVVI